MIEMGDMTARERNSYEQGFCTSGGNTFSFLALETNELMRKAYEIVRLLF